MPNWVTNTVKVENWDVLKEKLIDVDKYEVDFNKLIPMPEDLNITAGGYEWQEDKYSDAAHVAAVLWIWCCHSRS